MTDRQQATSGASYWREAKANVCKTTSAIYAATVYPSSTLTNLQGFTTAKLFHGRTRKNRHPLSSIDFGAARVAGDVE